MTERVGIVGGTFDPIHNGHIVAALAAQQHCKFDRTLMVVANDPWQRPGGPVAGPAHRFEMVRLACAPISVLTASDMEICRGGPSYTVETVLELAAPGREIILTLGADAIAGLDSWTRAGELAELVTIAAVHRGGEAAVVPSSRWTFESVEMPRLEISSTEIRERVSRRRAIDGLVPTSVVSYIEREGLYR